MFEIICKDDENVLFLWQWAKPYVQNKNNIYENLYIKVIEATKTDNDSYEKELEVKYNDFKKKSIKYNLMKQ